MRHRKRTVKLGVKSQHRRSMLANLVCSLIEHNRITTTIARAKEARRWADRMVTLGKKGTLHHRRRALAFLRHKPSVQKLFAEVAKQNADRQGGYTRVVRVGQRLGDAGEIAILEWISGVAAAPEPTKGGKEKKKADKTAVKKPEKKKAAAAGG